MQFSRSLVRWSMLDIDPPSSARKECIEPGRERMRVWFAMSTSRRVGKSSVGSMLSSNWGGRWSCLNFEMDDSERIPSLISFNIVTKSTVLKQGVDWENLDLFDGRRC